MNNIPSNEVEVKPITKTLARLISSNEQSRVSGGVNTGTSVTVPGNSGMQEYSFNSKKEYVGIDTVSA